MIAELASLDASYRRALANERGFVSPRLAVPLGAAMGGAAIGSAFDEKNPVKGGALGGLAGLDLGMLASGGGTWLQKLNSARIESMLSGMAIPKNIATNYIGAPAQLAWEMGSTRPITEALRLPTNLREFGKVVSSGRSAGPTMGLGSTSPGTPMSLVGRTISGIDQSALNAFQRAGVPQEMVDRNLFTGKNKILNFGEKANKVLSVPFPFQRVPFNILETGGQELYALSDWSTPMAIRRNMATLGSMAGGRAIGEWVSQDPQNRGPYAAILLSMMASKTAPATAAALTTPAVRAAAGLGSLTPMPEFAVNPGLSWLGLPPAGLRYLYPQKRQPPGPDTQPRLFFNKKKRLDFGSF